MDTLTSNPQNEKSDEWLNYLLGMGAQLTNKGNIHSFDYIEEEYNALTESAVLVPLLSTTPLRITGKDRLDFLHGQVSNDVRNLNEGEHNTSLMLNVKGHVLAQMQIFRRAEDFFIAVEDGAGELVKSQFQAHIIFDQVEISDLNNTLVSMTLLGNKAIPLLQEIFCSVPEKNTFIYATLASKILINISQRSLFPAFDLHILKKDATILFDCLIKAGALPAGETLLNIARVEAGISSAAYEGGKGILPQEIGLEEAISYKKGCYLGQEIMARIEARGNLKRELITLLIEKKPYSNEKVVMANNKTVGKIGTLVNHPKQGYLALASLRKDVEGQLTIAGINAQKVLSRISY